MSPDTGVTPFISTVHLSGAYLSLLKSISFTIAPKPGAVSAPVSVQWGIAAIRARGYYTNGVINLPVFGLYSGYTNQVSLSFEFQDGSTQTLSDTISTAAYTDPNGVYDHPTIIQAAAPGSALGFSFFVMKSLLSSVRACDATVETSRRVQFVSITGWSKSCKNVSGCERRTCR